MTVWAELAAPWQVAFEQAWAAYRAGSLPIGAALADRAGRIVGRGRNRIFETLAEPSEGRCVFGHRLAHAELNALVSLDHQATDPRECILYTTLEPCALCVGAVRMLEIKDVRYAARDTAAGSLALLEATDFMRRGRVVDQPLGQPEVEAATIALEVAAHLELVSGWRPDRWQAAGVPGVELGCQLFAAGALRRLADAGAPIEQVLDQLLGDPRLLAAEPPVRPAAELRAAPAVGPVQQAAAAQAGRRPLVLVITGAPASGKTTLGRQLAAALGLPYLSKDLFKETLFDSLGWQDRDWSRRLGGASMALLFQSAEALHAAGQSVALESNFYPAKDTPQLRALGERSACRFVQVVCTAPGPTLVERFERRARSGERHPGHADAASLDELPPRLLAERWDALELGGPSSPWTPPKGWSISTVWCAAFACTSTTRRACRPDAQAQPISRGTRPRPRGAKFGALGRIKVVMPTWAAPPSRSARSPTMRVSAGRAPRAASAASNRRGAGFWQPC